MYELHPRQQIRQSAPPPPANAFWRGVLSGSLAFVIALVLALSGALITYAVIARGMPSASALESSANALHSTYIYDRDGNLLSQLFRSE